MIERWRRKLQGVAMVMRLAYMMRTCIGVYNIPRIFMLIEFMKQILRSNIK